MTTSCAIEHLPIEEVTVGLQRWAQHHSDPARAAVDLLIWHETWIRRRAFLDACATHYPDQAMVAIRWHDADEFLEIGPRASTTELAVLELAIALGFDRYRLTSMGHAHRAAVLQAVTTAVGAR